MVITRFALAAFIIVCASCNHDAPQPATPTSSNESVAAGESKDVPHDDLIPQARPVVTWLKAVKNGDTKQLKTVFSENMQKDFDEEGWPKVLTTYQEVFNTEFGDYKLDDFAFEFDGGQESGTVSIIHKSKKLPPLRVIKENSAWKVNER